jgi:hypothetical protein
MFGFLKDKEKVKNLRELFDKRLKEIEKGGFVAAAFLGLDGLKIFSKEREGISMESAYPYLVRLFQLAENFEKKINKGLHKSNEEVFPCLIYQFGTKEKIFIFKGRSQFLEFFFIYVHDPDYSFFYSSEKTVRKISSWLKETIKRVDAVLNKK